MSLDTESWNTFGPMDQVQLGKLTESLDKLAAEYKVEVSEDEIARHQEEARNQPFRQHPTFTGMAKFYYIKIPTKNLLIVKRDLESVGFSIAPENITQPADVDEYLCTKCKFIAPQPGFCPNDGTKLLEFSEWVTFKKENASRLDGRIILGTLLIIAIGYLLTKMEF